MDREDKGLPSIAIVGGFPRAGTRQFTDILNGHPQVGIKGEIASQTFAQMVRMWRVADKSPAGTWFETRRRERLAALRLMSLDSFFRVHFLGLEQFVEATDRAAWVRTNIFAPLGLDVGERDAGAMLERTRNKNRTPDGKRREEVPPAELAALTADAAFMEQIRWLESATRAELVPGLVA